MQLFVCQLTLILGPDTLTTHTRWRDTVSYRQHSASSSVWLYSNADAGVPKAGARPEGRRGARPNPLGSDVR